MRLSHALRVTAALMLSLCCAGASVAPPAVAAAQVARETRYQLPTFGTVSVYRPAAAPRGVALFLSGDGGWTGATVRIARALSSQGLLVAGVSTPQLMKSLEHNRGKCINPNYPLVDLARDVQHRMAVRAYMKPIIVGYSAGATVAYAGLAQWPNGGYRGVMSIGFSADMPGHKRWCTAPGFRATPIVKPARGWLFAPSQRIKVPWIVVQGEDDTVVDPVAARRFASAVPNAKFIGLPKVGHGFAVQDRWLPQIQSAVASLLPALPVPGSMTIPDMPLTVIPARPGGASDTMAVLYSGDGGWVGIDRDIAQQLGASGIPVVGVDSLSYFWSHRTPAGAAADLNRVINSFGRKWRCSKVLLVGYSFGADTLPHIVRQLPPDTRNKIVSMTLLGFSQTADFQFHLSSWLNFDSAQALPTVPAVVALRGMMIRCVRGQSETDSACPSIPKGVSQNFIVPGGHHFNRNAALLTKIILGKQTPGLVQR